NCVTVRGITVGMDSICFRVCDSTGVCDTIRYTVTVRPNPIVVPTAGQVFRYVDTLFVDSTLIRCSFTRLTRIQSITNICATPSRFTATLNPTTRCVTVRGTVIGTDSTCFRVCDSTGVCDTIYYRVTVRPLPPPVSGQVFRYTDTIFVDSTKQRCLMTNRRIASFTNLCPGSIGIHTNFTLDPTTGCATYRGTSVGRDSACLRICDSAGVCDTVYLNVVVVLDTARLPRGGVRRIIDTVQVGQSRQFCGLTALTRIQSVSNFCSPLTGIFTTFTYDPMTRCVTYRGTSVGRDSACLRICDSSGVCDTIYFGIQVRPRDTVPAGGQVFRYVDTVQVGASGQRCNLTRLTRVMSLQNLCSAATGINTIFNLNPITNCVAFTGRTVGVDSACYRVCDSTGVCDTVYIRVVVIPAQRRFYRLNDTVYVNDSTTNCTLRRPTGARTIRNYCAASSGTFVNYSLDTTRLCVTYGGRAIGTDSACIVICDSAGRVCDTTIVTVTVIPRPILRPRVDSISLAVLELGNYCPDTSRLGRGRVSSIAYCAPQNFDNSTVRLDSGRFCLNIRATSTGRDTTCLVVCNNRGVCDTTTLYIIVRPDTVRPILKIDSLTIRLGQDTSYCGIDTTQIRGAVDTIYNICPISSNVRALVTINPTTKCLDLRGLLVGRDTACIVVCNRLSRVCDTTIVYIRVIDTARRPTPSFVSAPIQIIGRDTLLCNVVDTTEIGGRVATISNACPSRSGVARFAIDTATRCIRVTALQNGRDTACIVVCNARGVCDTTYIYAIIGNPRDTILIANDDVDTIRNRQPKVINLFRNDTIRLGVTNFEILIPPTKGRIDTISKGLIRYTPNPGTCGWDTLTYLVCVPNRCDTAIARIFIVCSDTLKAYSAISPNGDQFNQFFIIEGIERYPNHSLCIFNRWGERVLITKNYQNDFEGKWDGKELPDGTYFYLLRDEENSTILLSGYLQIFR
ncbi:MAG: hypothetical protein RL757_146, partial [Bacteroidota bacterium]